MKFGRASMSRPFVSDQAALQQRPTMTYVCPGFEPNVFNRKKCQNCFRDLGNHCQPPINTIRNTNERNSKGTILLSGYLFITKATNYTDSLNRSKKLQRRYSILYESGCLSFYLNETDNEASSLPVETVELRSRKYSISKPARDHGHELSFLLSMDVAEEDLDYGMGMVTRDIDIEDELPKHFYVKAPHQDEYNRWYTTLSMLMANKMSPISPERTSPTFKSGDYCPKSSPSSHRRSNHAWLKYKRKDELSSIVGGDKVRAANLTSGVCSEVSTIISRPEKENFQKPLIRSFKGFDKCKKHKVIDDITNLRLPDEKDDRYDGQTSSEIIMNCRGDVVDDATGPKGIKAGDIYPNVNGLNASYIIATPNLSSTTNRHTLKSIKNKKRHNTPRNSCTGESNEKMGGPSKHGRGDDPGFGNFKAGQDIDHIPPSQLIKSLPSTDPGLGFLLTKSNSTTIPAVSKGKQDSPSSIGRAINQEILEEIKREDMEYERLLASKPSALIVTTSRSPKNLTGAPVLSRKMYDMFRPPEPEPNKILGARPSREATIFTKASFVRAWPIAAKQAEPCPLPDDISFHEEFEFFPNAPAAQVTSTKSTPPHETPGQGSSSHGRGFDGTTASTSADEDSDPPCKKIKTAGSVRIGSVGSSGGTGYYSPDSIGAANTGTGNTGGSSRGSRRPAVGDRVEDPPSASAIDSGCHDKGEDPFFHDDDQSADDETDSGFRSNDYSHPTPSPTLIQLPSTPSVGGNDRVPDSLGSGSGGCLKYSPLSRANNLSEFSTSWYDATYTLSEVGFVLGSDRPEGNGGDSGGGCEDGLVIKVSDLVDVYQAGEYGEANDGPGQNAYVFNVEFRQGKNLPQGDNRDQITPTREPGPILTYSFAVCTSTERNRLMAHLTECHGRMTLGPIVTSDVPSPSDPSQRPARTESTPLGSLPPRRNHGPASRPARIEKCPGHRSKSCRVNGCRSDRDGRYRQSGTNIPEPTALLEELYVSETRADDHVGKPRDGTTRSVPYPSDSEEHGGLGESFGLRRNSHSFSHLEDLKGHQLSKTVDDVKRVTMVRSRSNCHLPLGLDRLLMGIDDLDRLYQGIESTGLQDPSNFGDDDDDTKLMRENRKLMPFLPFLNSLLQKNEAQTTSFQPSHSPKRVTIRPQSHPTELSRTQMVQAIKTESSRGMSARTLLEADRLKAEVEYLQAQLERTRSRLYKTKSENEKLREEIENFNAKDGGKIDAKSADCATPIKSLKANGLSHFQHPAIAPGAVFDSISKSILSTSLSPASPTNFSSFEGLVCRSDSPSSTTCTYVSTTSTNSSQPCDKISDDCIKKLMDEIKNYKLKLTEANELADLNALQIDILKEQLLTYQVNVLPPTQESSCKDNLDKKRPTHYNVGENNIPRDDASTKNDTDIQIDTYRDRVGALEKMVLSKSAECEDLRDEMGRLEKAVASCRKALRAKETQVSRLSDDKKLWDKVLGESERKNHEVRVELKDALSTIERLRVDKGALTDLNERYELALNDATVNQDSFETTLRRYELLHTDMRNQLKCYWNAASTSLAKVRALQIDVSLAPYYRDRDPEGQDSAVASLLVKKLKEVEDILKMACQTAPSQAPPPPPKESRRLGVSGNDTGWGGTSDDDDLIIDANPAIHRCTATKLILGGLARSCMTLEAWLDRAEVEERVASHRGDLSFWDDELVPNMNEIRICINTYSLLLSNLTNHVIGNGNGSKEPTPPIKPSTISFHPKCIVPNDTLVRDRVSLLDRTLTDVANLMTILQRLTNEPEPNHVTKNGGYGDALIELLATCHNLNQKITLRFDRAFAYGLADKSKSPTTSLNERIQDFAHSLVPDIMTRVYLSNRIHHHPLKNCGHKLATSRKNAHIENYSEDLTAHIVAGSTCRAFLYIFCRRRIGSELTTFDPKYPNRAPAPYVGSDNQDGGGRSVGMYSKGGGGNLYDLLSRSEEAMTALLSAYVDHKIKKVLGMIVAH